MRSLLGIEWLKIKRYRTFWVIISLFGGMLLLWNYGIQNGFVRLGGKDINILSQAYTFPAVWDNITYWSSYFVVFPAILVIILTTNEYQYRTNRQNIIDGWNRLQFYHAKWFMILSLSVCTTIFVFIAGLLFGFAGGGHDVFGHIEKIGYLFVLFTNYYGFCLLLSLLLKRSGLTIGLFLLYCMIIESILHMFFNYKIQNENLNLFLPLQCSDDLFAFPLMDMAKQMLKLGNGPAPSSYIIASCCWITVYYFLGRIKLMRSDW
jgi:hypothetical protein